MKKMNLRKKLFAGVVITSMMFSLIGCSSSAEGGESELADTNTTGKTQVSDKIDTSKLKLITDGVLTVGQEPGYPPFEDFAEDGKTLVGYDVDIITAVADKLGLDVNIINTAWDGIFEGIDVNYDCVCSNVTITPEREETMLFSDPYVDNYQAVVVKKDSDMQVNSFQDLNGKTIALQKSTTSDELMSDYKSTGTISLEIVGNELVTSCFTQLDNGEVDAIVIDSTVADGYVAKNADKYKIAYVDKEEPEHMGIAMGLNNTELQKAVNEALKELDEEGFIDETYEYWFGSNPE